MQHTVKTYIKSRFEAEYKEQHGEEVVELLTAELVSDLYLGSYTPLDLKSHLDERIDAVIERHKKGSR